MFNTMTLTKIVAGIGTPLLIFLLGNFAATGLYSTGSPAHGDAHEQTAATQTEADTGHGAEPAMAEPDTSAPDTAEPAEAEPTFADLLAAADIAKGEKVFKKCKACHKLEAGKLATGPSLFGVVGRTVGTEGGFKYSGTMLELGGQWTPERLDHFLTKPKDMVPGTKMSFAGLKKINDRANLVAYLATIGG